MFICLIQAKQYLILKLDIENKIAHARPTNVNYYTAARNRTDINVTKVIETATISSSYSVNISSTNTENNSSSSNSSSTTTTVEQRGVAAAACTTSISTGCADVVHTVYGFYKQWLGTGRVSNIFNSLNFLLHILEHTIFPALNESAKLYELMLQICSFCASSHCTLRMHL
jgi:hypothetical protein